MMSRDHYLLRYHGERGCGVCESDKCGNCRERLPAVPGWRIEDDKDGPMCDECVRKIDVVPELLLAREVANSSHAIALEREALADPCSSRF